MPIGATIGAAVIGGAASLAGGAMQSSAANQAAQTQAAAADKALALQTRQYEEGVARQQPWMDAGRNALDAYSGELGLSDAAKGGTFQSGFKTTPGYQFQLDQGREGVQNSLAALGMKSSGAGLKAITKYSQGLADQTYSNYLDRLSAASVGGQHQANALTQMGQNYANNASALTQDKAAATASGYAGSANAWGNALSGMSNTAGWALGIGSDNFGKGFWPKQPYVNPNASGNAVMRPGMNL